MYRALQDASMSRISKMTNVHNPHQYTNACNNLRRKIIIKKCKGFTTYKTFKCGLSKKEVGLVTDNA